jgi:thiamine kinase-like enzyme
MVSLDTKLFGNSGCEITKTQNYVSKKSFSVDYNNRLILQIAKQLSYNGNFYTPKITKIYNDHDGKLVAVMENCGNPVATIARENPLIERMLSWHLARSLGWADFRSQILGKFNQVGEKIEDKKFAQAVMNRAKMEDYKLPVGYCHGDLTLSNILVKDGEFYLIDFLEDWIPSPAFDMCKILQDCHYRWYTAAGEPFKDWHKDLGDKVLMSYIKTYGENHLGGVMLLTLYRIIPYCEKSDKGKFVKEIICREFL